MRQGCSNTRDWQNRSRPIATCKCCFPIILSLLSIDCPHKANSFYFSWYWTKQGQFQSKSFENNRCREQTRNPLIPYWADPIFRLWLQFIGLVTIPDYNNLKDIQEKSNDNRKVEHVAYKRKYICWSRYSPHLDEQLQIELACWLLVYADPI